MAPKLNSKYWEVHTTELLSLLLQDPQTFDSIPVPITNMVASDGVIAFVMIPGSFAGPWLYSKVAPLLTSAPNSFPSSSLHMLPLLSATPSRSEGPATMRDDASMIASKVNTLADEGRDIVLVMSSYGGFPGIEAAYGLSKTSRAKRGLPGGIISLVYIAAHIPQAGQSTNDFSDGLLPDDEYMSVEYSPESAQAVFSDLEAPEERKRYFDMMNNHSRISFDGQLKHEGWKEVKCYYMHTKKDKIIGPDVQLRQIDCAKTQGADLALIEIDAGHVPMLGREGEVCELLVMAAGGVSGRQK